MTRRLSRVVLILSACTIKNSSTFFGLIMTTSRNICAGILLATSLLATAAHAKVQFTYNSNPIEFNFSQVDGEYNDFIGANEKPSFSISFVAPDNWLAPKEERTDFSFTDFDVSATININEQDVGVTYTVTPWDTWNDISVLPDGSIFGWRFGFDVAPIFAVGTPAEIIHQNKSYSIYSAVNLGASCPCEAFDVYKNRMDVFTLNRSLNPLVVGTISSHYQSVNENNNWVISPVSAVPEPETYAMMMGGLGLFGFMVNRKRKQKPNSVPVLSTSA